MQLSNTAPFCKNYTKLYFDAKHLEKGLNSVIFLKKVLFFIKKCPFYSPSPKLLQNISPISQLYVTLMDDFHKTFVLDFYNSFLKIELNCDKENVLILIHAIFKRRFCQT